jgi:uncharacterized protein (TIGR03437 family)
LEVVLPGAASVSVPIHVADTTPGVFVHTVANGAVTLWSTGLGAVTQRGDLFETIWRPRVTINGANAQILFSGLAPGWPGLYQINAAIPPGSDPAKLEIQIE